MKELKEKKNEDLDNIIEKINELVGDAWTRGFEFGVEYSKNYDVEAEHELCVGDVVHTKLCSKENIVLGITKSGNQLWASVYTEDFDVPQMHPVENLIYTGKHIDITNIFEQLFNHIGDKGNA